jgi:hypothetical protein
VSIASRFVPLPAISLNMLLLFSFDDPTIAVSYIAVSFFGGPIFSSLASSMSSLVFVGFFSLRDGESKQTSFTKRSGEKGTVTHTYYKTAVACRKPPEIPADLRIPSRVDDPSETPDTKLPADLRVFTRLTDPIYPDFTLAFVIAKSYIPAGDVPGDLLLDALYIAPFPGDPGDREEYDNALPDFRWPVIFGLGTVAGSSDDEPDGQVSFPVAVSEYVRGSMKSSTIQYALFFALRSPLIFIRCVLDKTVPRWTNVPVPSLGSLIHLVGICSRVTLSGLLSIDIDNIVYCAAPKGSSRTRDSTDPDGSPSPKRRKYSAYAPPRVPIPPTIKTRTTPAAITQTGPSASIVSSSSGNAGPSDTRYCLRYFVPFLPHDSHYSAPASTSNVPLSPLTRNIDKQTEGFSEQFESYDEQEVFVPFLSECRCLIHSVLAFLLLFLPRPV